MQIQIPNLTKMTLVALLACSGTSPALAAPDSSTAAAVNEQLQDLQQLQELEELGELNEVAQAVRAQAAQAPAPMAVSQAPADASVNVVPVKAIYVYENQPVQILDSKGRLIQVIYLVRKK